MSGNKRQFIVPFKLSSMIKGLPNSPQIVRP